MTDLQKQAAEVVGRLTKAQQQVILTCKPNGIEASISALLSLCLSNLADVRRNNTVFLNPLGLAVRQILQDNPHARDNEERGR